MPGKASVRTAITVGTVLLILAAPSSRGYTAHTAAGHSAQAMQPREPGNAANAGNAADAGNAANAGNAADAGTAAIRCGSDT